MMGNRSVKDYFEKARKEKWALAQFNFSSAEQLQGIVLAAAKLSSPLLLGTSEKDAAFIGMRVMGISGNLIYILKIV